MAAHREHQHPANLQSDEGDQRSREDDPDHQRMPFPHPEQMDEVQRMAMAELHYVVFREGQPMGSEDQNSKVHKGQEQQPLQGGDRMNADLRGDMVQPENRGQQQHEKRGRPDEGIYSHHKCDRQAPGQPFRTHASLEQAQYRPQDPASQNIAHALGQSFHQGESGAAFVWSLATQLGDLLFSRDLAHLCC